MALASWGVFVITAGHWENQSPAEAANDDWLSPLALVWFVTAVVVFAGVLTARSWLVVPAIAVGAVIGLLALREALVEWSQHGDEELIAFACGVGALGLLAVVLTARASGEAADAG